MNDPMTAWVLQVYLRDRGLYLWLAPSSAITGGFQARVEKYDMFRGYVVIAHEDAETIQGAARLVAAQTCDLSGFEAWREEWEREACL